MQVFKFGGASINTANAVRKLFEIVCTRNSSPLIVIISAMGKSTNVLEEILDIKIRNNSFKTTLKKFKKYHLEICKILFDDSDNRIFYELNQIFLKLEHTLNRVNAGKHDWSYDQVISFGEKISSLIVSTYLNVSGLKCKLLPATDVIKTTGEFREARIIWDSTSEKIRDAVSLYGNYDIILSQGFIGADSSGNTTTLGREGSDFTAAIFANCLNATSLTVWKDVPGLMNADPRITDDPVMFNALSYYEASEMSYYGAKVIHPKTIRPLANKNIPLFVRGFYDYEKPGTRIHNCKSDPEIYAVIYKGDQCLFSFRFADFNFISEKSLVRIYSVLNALNIRINMMQNSAISFSICIDQHEKKIQKLIEMLQHKFVLHYNTGLRLVTIKNYDQHALEQYRPKVGLLLEQKSRSDYQAVFKPAYTKPNL